MVMRCFRFAGYLGIPIKAEGRESARGPLKCPEAMNRGQFAPLTSPIPCRERDVAKQRSSSSAAAPGRKATSEKLNIYSTRLPKISRPRMPTLSFRGDSCQCSIVG